MAGKKKEASLQVRRSLLRLCFLLKLVHINLVLLVQASVTNQEQWEEMLATKGLAGTKSTRNIVGSVSY